MYAIVFIANSTYDNVNDNTYIMPFFHPAENQNRDADVVMSTTISNESYH